MTDDRRPGTDSSAAIDSDVANLDRDTLIQEIKRLRAAIRAHRDTSAHDLCWHHPQLWNLLPEKTDPLPIVPEWPQFLRGCVAYRESLDRQLPDAPRTQVEFDTIGTRENPLVPQNSRLATSTASRIVDELNRAVDGDAWHGDSALAILRDVTPSVALARPHEHVHSIWEILRHMTAWTNEVARRLEGHAAGAPQEGDWPAPPSQSAEQWLSDVEGFADANRRLIQKVSALSDAQLHAPSIGHRDRAAGSGVPDDVMLLGLAQHHAYHAGQIALLKKLAARFAGDGGR